MKFTRRTAERNLLSLVVPVVLASCSTNPIEPSWGPPVGYTVVSGVVTYRSGVPSRGAEVMLTGCTPLIGGFFGPVLTDSVGRYRLVGVLPPIGVFSARPEEVQMSCAVAVSRVVLEVPPIMLHFGADPSTAPSQELNLTAP
jgi:hypothetical protein